MEKRNRVRLNPQPCSIAGCTAQRESWGLCDRHYRVERRTAARKQAIEQGLSLKKLSAGVTVEQRFWDKVEKTESCWLWRGSFFAGKKYGQYGVGARNMRVHRYAYILLKGEIPADLTLDHLCRNPACVNPEHLEPVTAAENFARHPKQAVCTRGHLRIPGTRRCTLCHRHQPSHSPEHRHAEYLRRKERLRGSEST